MISSSRVYRKEVPTRLLLTYRLGFCIKADSEYVTGIFILVNNVFWYSLLCDDVGSHLLFDSLDFSFVCEDFRRLRVDYFCESSGKPMLIASFSKNSGVLLCCDFGIFLIENNRCLPTGADNLGGEMSVYGVSNVFQIFALSLEQF